MTDPILQSLSAAKLWLISAPQGAASDVSPRDLPYLAQALYSLVPVVSHHVPTMSCDEWWRIYVNPGWISGATIPEVGAELAHVTWHLLQDHAHRARDLGVDRSSADAWSVAADMTIHHTLAPERACPLGLPSAESRGLKPGRSAEEYFAPLSGLPLASEETDNAGDEPDGCGSGADGLSRSRELPRDSDTHAVDSFEANEIRRAVAIEYRAHAQQRGTEPGDALRWVNRILEPRTSWEPLLASAVRRAIGWTAGRGDYTYRRPSRRAASMPRIVLPGQQRPVPRVAIIVDTSASVDDGLLGRALGEVDGVLSAMGAPGASLTIYSVDAAVHATQNLRCARDASLVGAGGTDLRIGLAAIRDQRPRPDVIIVLTDGGTPWPATPPPAAVTIIALLGRQGDLLPPTPTWALRIECLLE